MSPEDREKAIRAANTRHRTLVGRPQDGRELTAIATAVDAVLARPVEITDEQREQIVVAIQDHVIPRLSRPTSAEAGALREAVNRALSAAMSPAEPDLLARALWDCLVLSGADVSGYDGFEHWKRMRADGMAAEAVDGVKRLREDYDEACEEVSLSPAELVGPKATPKSELRRQAFVRGTCPICLQETPWSELERIGRRERQ